MAVPHERVSPAVDRRDRRPKGNGDVSLADSGKPGVPVTVGIVDGKSRRLYGKVPDKFASHAATSSPPSIAAPAERVTGRDLSDEELQIIERWNTVVALDDSERNPHTILPTPIRVALDNPGEITALATGIVGRRPRPDRMDKPVPLFFAASPRVVRTDLPSLVTTRVTQDIDKGAAGGVDPQVPRSLPAQSDGTLHRETGIDGPPAGPPPGDKLIPSPEGPMNPREVHERSIAAAHDLLEQIEGDTAAREDVNIIYLRAQLAHIEGRDADAATDYINLAERASGESDFVVATDYYFRAVTINGDETAHARLSEILNETRTSESEERYRAILRRIVAQCADLGLPADTWINDYSLDEVQIAEMKLSYFSQQQDAQIIETPRDMSIGQRYLTEVRDTVLNGEDLSRVDTILLAHTLWFTETDPEAKINIFERVRSLYDDGERDREMFLDVISIADAMLKDPTNVTAEQAQWMDDFAESGREELIALGNDPFTLNKSVGGLQIRLAHYFGASPEDIMAKIDTLTGLQLTTDTSEAAERYRDLAASEGGILRTRDRYLGSMAVAYAVNRDFVNAKLFLDNINDDVAREMAAYQCLGSTETIADIDRQAPDELILLLDNTAGELYSARRILIEGDPENVRSLALSKALDSDLKSDDIVDACVAWMYTRNPDDRSAGEQIERKILQLLEGYAANPNSIRRMAFKLARHGNTDGYTKLLENAERYEDPQRKLSEYITLALATAKYKDVH